VTIKNNALTSLNALSNLSAINGRLEVYGNGTLTDISGLENIDPNTITGCLFVRKYNRQCLFGYKY